MTPPRLLLGSLFSLTESLRFLIVVCLSCALTVGIAYGLTRYVVRHAAASPQQRVESLEQAARMRALSNELIALATEYLNQSHPALLEGPNAIDRWRATSFLPRLDDYRRRIIADAQDLPAVAPLLAAADTLSAQANRPPDPGGRETLALAVMDATTLVELAIGELGVGRYLNEPPRAFAPAGAPT